MIFKESAIAAILFYFSKWGKKILQAKKYRPGFPMGGF